MQVEHWSSAWRVPLRAGGLGLWTSGMVSFAALDERRHAPEARYATFQRHMRVWAHGLLDLFGVRLQSEVALPPAEGARLLVANHRSPIDVILLLSSFGGCCVSRSDLAEWPILGRAARRADTIFVDRNDPRSGAKAIRAMRERLKRGRTVIAFPEGGTFSGDEVRPFRGGAFAAARDLDVEIVPVGIAYPPGTEFVHESFGQHLIRTAKRAETAVSLCVGTPLRADAPRGTLVAAAQREVQLQVERARVQWNKASHPAVTALGAIEP